MDAQRLEADSSDVSAFYAARRKHFDNHATTAKAAKIQESLPLPKHGDGERFIRGPIPMEWMKLAARCGHRSEAVAVLLWYAAGWQKSNPVKLSKSILTELQVHPKTAKRVLLRMREFGLVEVTFHRGRSPVVTLTTPHERTEIK